MKRPPFHITTILFDCIVALAACFLAAFISIFIVVLTTTENYDHWRNGVFTLNIVWPVLFYTMRRRFTFKITLVQIVISAIITGIAGYSGFTLLDHFENAGDPIAYSVLFCILSIFVFTKQASDKYFAGKAEKIMH